MHLVPYFGDRPLARIAPKDIEAFIAASRRDGQSVKSTLNYVGLLHSVFEHAVRRGWATSNPCKLVEKQGRRPRRRRALPRPGRARRLLVAVPDDDVGRVERVLYLTAAMTGMRQGELLALR